MGDGGETKLKYSPIAITQRTLQSRNIHSIPPPTPIGLTVSGNNEVPHNFAIALPIGCSTAKLIIALLRDLFVILDIVAQHVSTAGCDDTYIDIRARPEVVGEPERWRRRPVCPLIRAGVGYQQKIKYNDIWKGCGFVTVGVKDLRLARLSRTATAGQTRDLPK